MLAADLEFVTIECSPNLVVAQRLEQAGKNLVGERKGGQFVLLVSSVVDDVQLLRCRFFG